MRPAPGQLSLFGDNSQRIMSSAGFVAGMKAAMRGIVEASGKSRDQVVDEMNRIILWRPACEVRAYRPA